VQISTMPEEVDRLLSRVAISEVQARFCHGVDRCDVEMLKDAYWPDGTEDHGVFVGGSMEFCEFIVEFLLRNHRKTSHYIQNMLIEFEGSDDARVETYGLHYEESAVTTTASLSGGRYIDRFQRRNGVWRILHRVYVFDWIQPMTRPTDEAFEAVSRQFANLGGRFPNDAWDMHIPKMAISCAASAAASED